MQDRLGGPKLAELAEFHVGVGHQTAWWPNQILPPVRVVAEFHMELGGRTPRGNHVKYRTPGGVQDGLVVGKCSVDILARGRTRAAVAAKPAREQLSLRRPGAGNGDGGEEVMEEIVAVFIGGGGEGRGGEGEKVSDRRWR